VALSLRSHLHEHSELFPAVTPYFVMKVDHVPVNCSTAQPDATRHLAAAIAIKGAGFLDAALTGTAKHAQDGQLNLLVGCDKSHA
jgi:3-hydroxyisobutyrate dehydrogenase-like beta-hydroxyacid dehydrogenase